MAIPITYETQHFGNKIIAPNLEEAKISDKVPTTPQPGHVYLKNGVVHYRNNDNAERPIHEDAIREIIDPDGVITSSVTGHKATIAIAPADATKPGFITPEHYALLAGAKVGDDGIYGDDLVLRNADGNIIGYRIIADEDVRAAANIIAGNAISGAYLQVRDRNGIRSTVSVNPGYILGLEVPPPDDGSVADRGSFAVSVDHLESEIEIAIATANATAAQNIANIIPTPPILATRSGQNVTLDIALATETTPGALSSKLFSLLAPATNDPTAIFFPYVKGGVEGETTLVDINFINASTINAAIFTAITQVETPRIVGLNTDPNSLLENYAAPVGYVNNQIQNALRDAIAGMDRKAQGVRAAIGVDTPLTSTFGTYDGETITAADTNKSILLYGQANPIENGAYNVTATGLVRREDSNTTANLSNGASYQVESGTNANHIFTLVSRDGFVIDTDPLMFLDISGTNVLRSGSAISIVNQTINARTTIDRIIVNADNSLDIAPAYDAAVDKKIADAIAADNQNIQDVAHGGTGGSTVTLAQQNLGIEATVISVLGDGAAKVFRVIHGLGTMDVSVDGLYLGQSTFIDHSPIDSETVEIRASLGSTPIPTNSLRVKITGVRNNSNVATVAATAVT